MSARLPTVGGDDNDWGDILNAFLQVSHDAQGNLLPGAVSAALPNPIPTSHLGNGAASSSNFLRGDGTWATITSTSVSDATPSVPGIIQLDGDLGGTAASPQVVSTHLSSALPINQGGTGSITQNFVDLSSSQIVAGTKTFSSTIGGNISGNAATVTTNANLTGDITSVGNSTTLTNSANVESVIAANSTVAGKAPLNSPALTGTPTAPTAITGTNTTQLATTAFVATAVANGQAPNATNSMPGLMQLGGDLGNTATSPEVESIQGVVISGTPSNGQVLTASSSTAATWSSILGWINVKTAPYGAAGNGTTDDTAAIQTAINAASSGGVVYLPAGTYLLNGSSALSLANVGVKLTGDGTGVTVIKIGASFSAAEAIAITADSCKVSDLSILGASSTLTSNPACNGIEITGSQHVKIQDIFMQYINGWAIESVGGSSRGNLDTMYRSIIARNCAGGMHIKGVSGSSFQGEQFATDIQLQNIGAVSGVNANLDAYLIEDCQDVLTQGINAAVAGGSLTGSTIHIKGACTSCYFTNIDVGMITLGAASPTILVESSSNGNPNCAFDNGVVQAGNYGISVTAGTDIVFGRMQIKLNGLHGVSLTGGSRVYLQGCSFSSNNQSGGTAYDIYAALSTFGFVEDCIAASPVGAGAGNVTNPVNDSTQKLYVFNTAFIGSGNTPSNVFASGGTPQIVRSSPGYNPRGAITAPTIGASPYTVSTSQNDVTIVFTAVNGMTAFKIGGTSVGVPTTGQAYHIPARLSVEVDWATTAPTWIWIAD